MLVRMLTLKKVTSALGILAILTIIYNSGIFKAEPHMSKTSSFLERQKRLRDISVLYRSGTPSGQLLDLSAHNNDPPMNIKHAQVVDNSKKKGRRKGKQNSKKKNALVNNKLFDYEYEFMNKLNSSLNNIDQSKLEHEHDNDNNWNYVVAKLDYDESDNYNHIKNQNLKNIYQSKKKPPPDDSSKYLHRLFQDQPKVKNRNKKANGNNIDVYTSTDDSFSDIECMNMYAIEPAPIICIFDTDCDRPISDSIKSYGIFEPRVTMLARELLLNDSSLNIIEIGSHIGLVSTLAGSYGRQVLATDGNRESLRRLAKSAKLGNFTQNITLLHNLIYDKRGLYDVKIETRNKGSTRILTSSDIEQNTYNNSKCIEKQPQKVKTILMDDLENVVTFNNTILKIYLQGQEHRAFKYASKLFDKIYIPFIIIDWQYQRDFHFNMYHSSADKALVHEMLVFLFLRDYRVYSLGSGLEVDYTTWYSWPGKVLLVHSSKHIHTPIKLRD